MDNLINNAINSSDIKIGVYSLSYCGGCNYVKGLLDEANIPYENYQLNNLETGSIDSARYQEFSDFRELYDTAGTVPKIITLSEDEQWIDLTKEFNHCADNSNLTACITSFIDNYNSLIS